MRKIIIAISTIILTLAYSLPGLADIAVIVHPDNSNTLNAKDVRKIYLGKTKAFPDGSEVKPLDLLDGDSLKDEFTDKALRKSAASLNSYWSRMLFSSKGKPPKAMTAAQVKAAVAANKDAIGYINNSEVDGSVKVILTIQ